MKNDRPIAYLDVPDGVGGMRRAKTYGPLADPTCMYCGVKVEIGLLYNACDECDTRNHFSDRYKEENGFRPNLTQWTLDEMKHYMGWDKTERLG